MMLVREVWLLKTETCVVYPNQNLPFASLTKHAHGLPTCLDLECLTLTTTSLPFCDQNVPLTTVLDSVFPLTSKHLLSAHHEVPRTPCHSHNTASCQRLAHETSTAINNTGQRCIRHADNCTIDPARNAGAPTCH